MRVLATEPGKGKYSGVVGALVVKGPSGPVKVNAGTDKQRKEWAENPFAIVDKIVEVYCLGFTASGSLREPTLGEIRFDKEEADF